MIIVSLAQRRPPKLTTLDGEKLVINSYGHSASRIQKELEEAGLNVTIVPGGGDISETTAVNNGTVDFGVTWVSNLISANAGGMDLVEISQIYQRSGLVLVYKNDNFSK